MGMSIQWPQICCDSCTSKVFQLCGIYLFTHVLASMKQFPQVIISGLKGEARQGPPTSHTFCNVPKQLNECSWCSASHLGGAHNKIAIIMTALADYILCYVGDDIITINLPYNSIYSLQNLLIQPVLAKSNSSIVILSLVNIWIDGIHQQREMFEIVEGYLLRLAGSSRGDVQILKIVANIIIIGYKIIIINQQL